MAFKILSWCPNRELEVVLSATLEDLPYEIVVQDDALASNPAAKEQWLVSVRPNAIISLLPSTLADIDDAYLEQVSQVVAYCAVNNVPIIQVSSYRVFGEGYSVTALQEDAEPGAQDELGVRLNKLEALYANLSQKIIVRTGWLLNSAVDSVFAQLIPPLLERDSKLVVSDHHFGCPLPKEFLAKALVAMSQQILCGAENWGVFHLHSADSCSEAELGDQLVRVFNADYQQDLQLPTVASKDDSRYHFVGSANILGRRCTDNFGIQLPTWRKGFKNLVAQWLKSNAQYSHLLDLKTSDKK